MNVDYHLLDILNQDDSCQEGGAGAARLNASEKIRLMGDLHKREIMRLKSAILFWMAFFACVFTGQALIAAAWTYHRYALHRERMTVIRTGGR